MASWAYSIIFVLSVAVNPARATTLSAPHLPVSHCYHWLSEENGHNFLQFKYDHADKNDGELTFYTKKSTSNGDIAGSGLYCGKSFFESFHYGNRVIKITFVDDVVVRDDVNTQKNICGIDGKWHASQAECDKKTPDVIFYAGGKPNDFAYYVIKNPQAIKSWSTASEELINEFYQAQKDIPAAVAHSMREQSSHIPSHILKKEIELAKEKMDLTLEGMKIDIGNFKEITYENKKARKSEKKP